MLPLSLFVLFVASVGVLLPGIAAAQFTRVDVAPDGSPGNGRGATPAISADGRIVAFLSDSSNLVPGDTNQTTDVFVRDLLTHVTTRVSTSPTGVQVQGVFEAPTSPAISGNGRFVAFSTRAKLLPQDTNVCVIGNDDGDIVTSCTDIYMLDLQTHELSLISVASDGTIGNNNSAAFSVSADGRFVAFETFANNLAPGATNPFGNLLLRDRVSGTTTPIPHEPTGFMTDPVISGDGNSVAFTIGWTTQFDGVDNPCGRAGLTDCHVPYVFDRPTGQTHALDALPLQAGVSLLRVHGISTDGRVVALDKYSVGPSLASFILFYDRALSHVTTVGTSMLGAVSMRDDGRAAVLQASVTPVGQGMLQLYDDRLHNTTDLLPPGTEFSVGFPVALSGNGLRVAFTSRTDLTGTHAMLPDYAVFVLDLDADGDGMLDSWERRFGLDPTNPNDAAADPDGDGKSNLAEYLAGTHPNGKFTRYLAEGSNNTVFITRIAILNPQSTPATVLLRLQNPTGANPLTLVRTIEPHRRATFEPGTEQSLAGYGDFSTVIESDVAVVVDRTMTVHEIGHGSHAETSSGQPSMTWYFAEGATGGPFSLFYLLQNPTDAAANVTVTYLLPAPQAPLVKTYVVAPQSRRTIFVDEEDPLLQATDVSAKITSDQPILAERSLYLASLGQPFGAALAGAAVPAPQLKWFLAEGATGSFFDLYILLANAETTDANVTLTFLLPDGTNFSKTYTVDKQSRRTLLIDAEDNRLRDTAVSIIAESTNHVPIIVERSMWWPEGGWYEGHLAAGATTTATKWALADGEINWGQSETYILIANTSPRAGQATVTLMFETASEQPITVTVPLPANSRTNVPVSTLSASFFNKFTRFGATIESDGVDLVVERSMYASDKGVLWSSGSASLGTPIP